MLQNQERRNCVESVLYRGKKKIWYVGHNGFYEVRTPTRELFLQRPVFAMMDHDGAGKMWNWAYYYGIIPAGSTLVHVDAHDDLSTPSNLPTNLEQLMKEEYEVGSFIMPRVNAGIIDNIVWIQPKLAAIGDKFVMGSDYYFLRGVDFNNLLDQPKIDIRTDIPTMKADLLDIDLDFFTYGLIGLVPDFILRGLISKYIKTIIKKVNGIKVVTIAVSPGYIQSGREKACLSSALNALLV